MILPLIELIFDQNADRETKYMDFQIGVHFELDTPDWYQDVLVEANRDI